MMAPPFEELLKAEAVRLGFSHCGVAPAAEAESFQHFEQWLDAGFAASMNYLHNHREARRHPASILPSVRSVVMLAFDYAPSSHPESAGGKVARYAQGPDYHEMLWAKLAQLADWIRERHPHAECRGVTDSAPLLERDFARRAGLGWFGKNTMLIHPRRGSYFLLATLLTNLDLLPDAPFETNHCGSCTACLDACPTQAFPQPRVLDANKCISYLTIEHRGAIDEPQHAKIGDWLFGCDICQEVCPWNRFAEGHHWPHRAELQMIDCEELQNQSDAEIRARFRGTSLLRAKPAGLRRNAAVVAANRKNVLEKSSTKGHDV
jgi:epoxyqueuosine reductase